jgi:hypothetical protein
MYATLPEVKSFLQEEGLHVSYDANSTLIVAAHVKQLDDGVQMSNDSCAMFPRASKWVAIFPGAGQRTYEVQGELSELVPLVIKVYREYSANGGDLSESFRRTMSNPDSYLK